MQKKPSKEFIHSVLSSRDIQYHKNREALGIGKMNKFTDGKAYKFKKKDNIYRSTSSLKLRKHIISNMSK